MNEPITTTRRIYVASSWRCPDQPAVVQALRDAGHEVYDFRNPPEATGFAWSEIDPEWLDWTVDSYRDKLGHPRAVQGFASDFDAMQWADTFVLVLPCGRSAHLELGWAVGQGKRTAILLSQDKFEPELMYRMVDKLAVSLSEVVEWVGSADDSDYETRDEWHVLGGRYESVMQHTNPDQTPERYEAELSAWAAERRASRAAG